MNTAISIKNLHKSHESIEVFKGFNLEIEKEKITTIFGPNGSGKSTLLNIISNIENKDNGIIDINGYNQSDIGYVFQSHKKSLFPWRTNFRNLSYPLELKGIDESEIKARIEELQDLFNLIFDLGGYPYNLSGGQQQILSFLRALVVKPKLLLVDEPFSALDYENSLRLRNLLQDYYLKYKPTVLFVSHSIENAVYLAEKIIVFSDKPTQVLDAVKNSLSYPRTIDTIKSNEFHKICDQTLSLFQKNVKA